MKSLNIKKLPKLFPEEFKIRDKAFFIAAFLLSFLFMSHPDLWETANHSYVFLESLFSGNVFNFYEFCAAHNNTYYYINVANYNIFMYILFGLWELPVFLFNKRLGLALNEIFIWYWAKALCCAFFVGCGYMVKQIGVELGFSENKARFAAMFFLFYPVAFFSPMAMGQYDVLCLFFTLWAMVYYMRDDMKKFSLVMGVSFVYKFFSLMIFVPLLLLKEKKILNLIKYGLMSLWLYIPSTLLYMGRTGNAAVFTQAMIDRMFEVRLDMGMRIVPVFMLLYAIIVFVSFLYVPGKKAYEKYLGIYIPMVVFCLLFNYIYWHPQWLVLVIPFIVLTTFMQENQSPWFYLDIVFCRGFFLFALYNYSNQTGAVLFDGGLIGHILGLKVITSPDWKPLLDFMVNIPYVYIMTPVMFSGAIFANIILKFPVSGQTVSDKLSCAKAYDKIPTKIYLYMIFVIGFIVLWLCPSALEWLNAMAII